MTPTQYKLTIFKRQGGRCAVTGEKLKMLDDAHHPLTKQELRARGLHDHVYDPRNGVGVKERIHTQHTCASKRIPREALDDCVWEFCAEMDALGPGQWATAHVERRHPSDPEFTQPRRKNATHSYV